MVHSIILAETADATIRNINTQLLCGKRQGKKGTLFWPISPLRVWCGWEWAINSAPSFLYWEAHGNYRYIFFYLFGTVIVL